MKKSFILAAAAMAVLSACTKEIEVAPINDSKAPVFTATIEPETKTTITDGSEAGKKMVNWANGDQISINGSLYSTTSTTNTATFSLVDGQTAAVADAQSKYKAVYPASLYDNGTLTLPASYTYTEGKFNMPMYAESESTGLAFKNICAVLAITVPSTQMSSVTSIIVSSNNQMNGAFTATAAGVLSFAGKTLEAADKKVTLTFSAAKAISSSETFYIAIPANTYAYLQIYVTDGTNTRTMKTKAASITVARNKIYPIAFMGDLSSAQYVDLGLSVKWATFNVGATTPEGYGDYFAWGATEPLYEAGYAQEDSQTHWKAGKTAGYIWNNTPYQTANTSSDTSTKWTKYLGSTSSDYKDESATDADAIKTVLDLVDDAARANWGGSWRMPTKEEWTELSNNCTWTWITSNDVKGYKVQSKKDGFADKYIFLPAAGYRNYGYLTDPGSFGYYWSSSLTTSDPYKAEPYKIYYGGTLTSSERRRYGYSVRPVLDTPAATNLSASGTANCYIVSGAGTYKFQTVQGNEANSVGTVASAVVLWESFGTNTAPKVGELISDVSYAENYITFSASAKKGNAVIAAKDADGNILWSWHIWLTDTPADVDYGTAGKMMDHNLGATSTTPGSVETYGLLYQWGRKDPFLNVKSKTVSGTYSSNVAEHTGTLNEPAYGNAANGNEQYSILHPTVFLMEFNYGDWHYNGNDGLWGKDKTVYDPCPAGYRVPDADFWDKQTGDWDSTNKGRIINGSWYPASGIIKRKDGTFANAGTTGYYWTVGTTTDKDSSDRQASALSFGDSSIKTNDVNNRAWGFAVRCQKIQ